MDKYKEVGEKMGIKIKIPWVWDCCTWWWEWCSWLPLPEFEELVVLEEQGNLSGGIDNYSATAWSVVRTTVSVTFSTQNHKSCS